MHQFCFSILIKLWFLRYFFLFRSHLTFFKKWSDMIWFSFIYFILSRHTKWKQLMQSMGIIVFRSSVAWSCCSRDLRSQHVRYFQNDLFICLVINSGKLFCKWSMWARDVCSTDSGTVYCKIFRCVSVIKIIFLQAVCTCCYCIFICKSSSTVQGIWIYEVSF